MSSVRVYADAGTNGAPNEVQELVDFLNAKPPKRNDRGKTWGAARSTFNNVVTL